MSATNRHTPMLAGIALVLLITVAADRAGMFSRLSPEDSSGLRGEYLGASADSEAERALVGRADAWREAAGLARAEWDRVSREVVRAATPELAETRFREVVLASMEDIRLISPARINYVRDGASSTGPVRTLRLSVEFDAATPGDACTIVDRLEHLPSARARIETLKLDGPGRIQLPEQVTVSVTLSTTAFIGEEAS